MRSLQVADGTQGAVPPAVEPPIPVSDPLPEPLPNPRGLPDDLCAAVYKELCKVAAWHLSSISERITHSPTDLVHEAVARVCQQEKKVWESESHLLAITALMIRRVLINHLRHRNMLKRRGSPVPIRSDEPLSGDGSFTTGDLFALDEALQRLRKIHPRQAVIVELKFFGGLESPVIAEYLGVSVRTVQLAWNHARLWLARELCDA